MLSWYFNTFLALFFSCLSSIYMYGLSRSLAGTSIFYIIAQKLLKEQFLRNNIKNVPERQLWRVCS
ncbi:hypothetical protein KDA_16060 [Dictyobacter alpinus]|uniref:Uncharacterized protein n=1 Tax=Dictyobacter alpinus TaxID=2014873 RepID=A0A402B457_9CHLR|nr:hypothetical protein KDA_16060 [Dictyobacter alpinus]